MSINCILCHPQADSLATAATADAYAAQHPDSATWTSCSTAQKETLLTTASRHICLAPLADRPLLERINTYLTQSLPVPVLSHKHRFGRADSGTTTTLVDQALASYPDDLFNGGAVWLREGTGEGQWAEVSDFDAASATLTFAELSEAPDETSAYLLIWPLSPPVRAAVCEQALYLVKGVNLSLLNQAGMGVASRTISGEGGSAVNLNPAGSVGHLCHAARRLLARAGLLRSDRSAACARG